MLTEGSETGLPERIRDIFTEKRMSLCVAESITGGMIASTLTSASGASKYFHSSVVSYSPDAKQRFLGVDPDIPEGLVSGECALAMAEGALRATGADIALSTTGNAGPEALEGKPVGLVFVAIARKGDSSVKRLELSGGRNEIRGAATRAALEFLAREVDK